MANSETIEHVYYRLTKDDLVGFKHAWRFPLLRISDLEIEEIYANGDLQANDRYEEDRDLEIIIWRGQRKPYPDDITVHFKLPKTLPKKEDKEFWQKLAIILPVVATIMSPILLEVTKSVLGSTDYGESTTSSPLDRPVEENSNEKYVWESFSEGDRIPTERAIYIDTERGQESISMSRSIFRKFNGRKNS